MVIKYEKYTLSRILSVQAIVSADCVLGSFHSEQYHTHQDAWELIISLNGTIEVAYNEHFRTLKKNQLFLIQPGEIHVLNSNDEHTYAFIISFTCSNNEHLFPLQNRVIQVQQSALNLIDGIIQELKSSFSHPDSRLHLFRFIPNSASPVGAEQMICCYLELFLITLLRNITMMHGNIISSDLFRKTCHSYISDQINCYIQDNLHAFLSVQGIANYFHYSRARLSALYKEATGINISEAISNAQIQAAKDMLLDRDSSITQIADALGFSTPQYFSRKFSKVTGCSPSQYAKKNRRA